MWPVSGRVAAPAIVVGETHPILAARPSRSPHHTPRSRTGVRTFFNDQLAVDENMNHSRRKPMRVFISSMIGNAGGVEDGNVREKPCARLPRFSIPRFPAGRDVSFRIASSKEIMLSSRT